MRILALDWGTVRIGAAISDPEGKIAFALDEPILAKSAIVEIKKLVTEQDIEKILIGLPKSLAGSATPSSEAAQKFGQRIDQETNCEIQYIDERLSSVAAIRTLNRQGVSARDQRGQVDNIAAQALLQAFLDTKNN
ncbi:MAG TPA: Holliday junction resolvase RuvX [Patescibacteria group bacterium]|nr:Holliday junction resolvase RuvX [Patescibacteria group bacterium]